MDYNYYITPEEYERAELNGVSAPTLEFRIRSLAWPKEKAVSTPPVQRRKYKEMSKLAEQNGICYSTFKARVNRYGWDVERAATQPLQDRQAQGKRAKEQNRKYPKEYLDLAKANGISYSTFWSRIIHGWPFDKAATTPLMTRREIGLMTKEKRQRSW